MVQASNTLANMRKIEYNFLFVTLRNGYEYAEENSMVVSEDKAD